MSQVLHVTSFLWFNILVHAYNQIRLCLGKKIYFYNSSSIYLSFHNNKLCIFLEIFKLINNQFLSNWATEDGGAISYKLQRPSIISNYFSNNSAKSYGNKISSYAIKAKLVSENSSYSKIPGNLTLRPSQNSIKISVAFFDIDNQLVNMTDNSILFHLRADVLNETAKNQIKNFQIYGKLDSYLNNGMVIFSALNYQISPLLTNQTISLFMTSDKNFFGDLTLILNILTDNCLSGEVFNSFVGECVECQFGTFSFSPLDAYCKSCPFEAKLCNLNVRDLKPGYWVSPYSQNIIECSPFADSCL